MSNHTFVKPELIYVFKIISFFELLFYIISNFYDLYAKIFNHIIASGIVKSHSFYAAIEIFISVDILFLILAVNSYRQVIEGSRLTARRKVSEAIKIQPALHRDRQRRKKEKKHTPQ